MPSARIRSHERMFQQLQQFVETHHRLPRRHEEDLSEAVFLWMCRMRSKHERGLLRTDQIQLFATLSVDPLAASLRQQRRRTMNEIADFHALHNRWPGHSDDEVEASLYDTLRRWRARIRFTPTCVLAVDLEERLPELSQFLISDAQFRSAKDALFEQKLSQVESFLLEHGRMPSASRANPDEYRLNRWYQRAVKMHDEGSLNSYKGSAMDAFTAKMLPEDGQRASWA